ncbi:MAG: MEDS domain-containing protein [Candidatus Dormibacteria bacterium]
MTLSANGEVALGWGSETVPVGTHACYYYSDDDTLHASLTFLKAGLDTEDDFCVIFADQSRFPQLTGWLAEVHGAPVDGHIQSGKLALIPGATSVEELVSSIGARLDRAIRDGYRLIRFLGFIGWGEPEWPDEESLLAFEAQVNSVVTAFPAVIICTYGVPALTGRQLITGGLQTHPVAMMGPSVALVNPFCSQPAEPL